VLGEASGSETVTLLESQIPAHAHTLSASNQPGEDASPQGEVLARSVGASLYQTTTNQNVVSMGPAALAVTGGGQPHNNMQPFLTLNFCIALQGIFPPRS
jgi:microcystin-dependent protein